MKKHDKLYLAGLNAPPVNVSLVFLFPPPFPDGIKKAGTSTGLD